MLVLLNSCASLSGLTRGSDLAGHAESVFRHQNELNSRLMLLSEADALPDDVTFEKSEQAMHDACYLLNEYAERENDGESIDLSFKQQVLASVDGCDVSIKTIETMLIETHNSQVSESVNR